MYHLYDIEDARKYGIGAAVLLNYLQHWVLYNKANETNYYDERYWTYNSLAALHEQFPEFSERQIRSIMTRLINEGIIMTGNYNKQRRDRTLWYAFTDSGAERYLTKNEPEGGECHVTEVSNATDENVKCNCPECQMQVTEMSDHYQNNTQNNTQNITPKIRPVRESDIKHGNNNINGISASAGADAGHKLSYEKEFELIWAKYPTCRKQGKKRAFAAFIRARRGGTSWAEIDDGLTAYKNYIARRGIRDEFIQQGGTWFTGEGWRDEYGGGKNDDISGRGSGIGGENDRTFVPSTGFRRGNEQIPDVGAGEGA